MIVLTLVVCSTTQGRQQRTHGRRSWSKIVELAGLRAPQSVARTERHLQHLVGTAHSDSSVPCHSPPYRPTDALFRQPAWISVALLHSSRAVAGSEQTEDCLSAGCCSSQFCWWRSIDHCPCCVKWKQFQWALHPPQLVEAIADHTTDVRLKRLWYLSCELMTLVRCFRHRTQCVQTVLIWHWRRNVAHRINWFWWVEAQAVGFHPLCHVIQAAQKSVFSGHGFDWLADNVHLRIVHIEMRFNTVLARNQLKIAV